MSSPSLSRRQLIKGLAAAGLAGCLPAALAAQRKPGKHSLGVALVGLGHYSRDLLAPAPGSAGPGVQRGSLASPAAS